MPLVAMKDMINHATHNGYALGGFHIFNLESLAAVIAAAEASRAPLILSVDHSWAEVADTGMLLAAAEHAAQHAKVPVGLHFERAAEVDAAVAAIRWGCNGVAVDGSQLALPENIELTRSVVDMAAGCGIPVEGLVGCIAAERRETAANEKCRVEPASVDEARAFVERTGVDVLAVTVGTGGNCQGKGKLDMQRVARIRAAVSVPLVMYGGNSLSDDQIRRLVAQGVARINFSTNISDFTAAENDLTVASAASSAEQMRAARDSIREYVLERLLTLGSAGRAAEVLLHCRAWEPIEHIIIFNVDTTADLNIDLVLAQGRQVLSEIPGVRYVYTGEAIQSGAAYRFCWLVRFVHPAVIDSYRDHPVHKRFADELFRPIAPARISIDFQITTAIKPVQPDASLAASDEAAAS